jgi:ribosome-associated protein
MNEIKSKTQKKRDAQALNALGEELVRLSDEKLKELPLSPVLRQAIAEAKLLKSFGAIKRHALWIGKLIRKEGGEALSEAYAKLQEEDAAHSASFHLTEQWRERLVQEEPDALTAFIESHPDVDIQHLRHLIKKAREESLHTKRTGAGLSLFRYIRQFIQ